MVSEETDDGQFTLSVSAPIVYGVNNAAPKGLRVEVKLVVDDDKLEQTVIVDTVTDDLDDCELINVVHYTKLF